MAEQIITKTCRTCKEIKPISEFYKDSHGRNGFSNRCKICDKKYHQSETGKAIKKCYNKSEKGKTTTKHYRQSEKGKATLKCYKQSKKSKAIQKRYDQSEKRSAVMKRFKIRHPERFKAIYAVNNAIRAGKLPRPDSLQCHYCPAQAEEYHHYNGYEPEHWFDVVPVCIKCHNKIPKKQVISAIV